MVIFAAAGAVVVIGAAMYEDHSDHSDYSDYSDHSDYSDAAERKRRRLEAKKQEIEADARRLSAYKREDINPRLSDEMLKQAPVMHVSHNALDRDARSKIESEIDKDIEDKTSEIDEQLRHIDYLLGKIEEIQEEEKP